MAERIYMDPTELTSRGELDITPWIDVDGPDWGDAQIAATMASQRVGATPVDYTIPPRQIQIPLILKTVGGTTFATIRSAIQAKVGLWQGQGGYIKRITSSGGTVYCDITNATLRLGGGWSQAHKDYDLEAVITCEAIPDFYGNEETLSDHTETTAAEITFTETTTNGGDFPLGDRVRVVVDDDSGNNQRGLIWAFRGRHYSSASTAASAYEAEALTTLDTATRVAKVGASGGTVVTHGTLSTNWTPVLSTDVVSGGTFALTHTGTNRIYARVFSTSGTAVQARFVYDVGDLVYPVENDAKRLYDGGTFHILDLGEARLDPTTGTHRWQGQIQAKGDAGAESFSVDRLYVVNQDESAGILRASPAFSEGLANYSARSEFTTESGAITGDSLAVGGAWTVVTGADTDDFTISSGAAARSTSGDTGSLSPAGRFVTAGTSTYSNIAARLTFKISAISVVVSSGLILRVVDASNYLAIKVIITSAARLNVTKVISGSPTDIVSAVELTGGLSMLTDTNYEIAASVDAAGQIAVWFGPPGGLRLVWDGYDSTLVTGGTLASGRVGMFDSNTAGATPTRTYDNFAAWVPSQDAVTHASQSTELATTGIRREDSTGTAYGPVSIVSGDLPRMPNRASAGTVEFMAKLSRGDLQSLPDSGIDDVSARVYRRPSYLTVP